jgi:hypothetical protein
MPTDDDDRPDGQRLAWTREQLLRARGYSDEVIAGHATTNGVTALAESDPPASPGPVCRQCGTQLDGPVSRRWCSDKCRRRWRTEHEPPRQRSPDGTVDTKPLSVDQSPAPEPAVSVNTKPLSVDAERATGIDVVVAALLERPWAELVVRLDGVTVTVVREDRPIVTAW